jgi:hypothetical protein
MDVVDRMKEKLRGVLDLEDPRGAVDEAILELGGAVWDGEEVDLDGLDRLAIRHANAWRGSACSRKVSAALRLAGAAADLRTEGRVVLPGGRVVEVRSR